MRIFAFSLLAVCSSIGCGSSNTNRPDPRAEERQNERIRADAENEHKALQKEEDRRDDKNDPDGRG